MPTIKEAFATGNDRYKANYKLNPVGVVLHSVGCPQPSSEVFVKLWGENRSQCFTHYVLDDQDIYHTMPDDRRCAHVGSPGNSKWLGIEMCEPKQITYTSGAKFTVKDRAAAQAFVKACYQNAVWLLAKLCKEHGWDPKTAILTHGEVSKKKLSHTSHVDPEHLWTGLGLPYTLSTLREDVALAMGSAPEADKPAAGQLYRIRKSWTDAASQIGAYANLEYAIAACKDGYAVFDQNGKQVWPEEKPEPAEDVKLDAAKSKDSSLSGTYRVTADYLNVRTGAGTDKRILTAIPEGTKVTCYGFYTRAANGTRWLFVSFTQNGEIRDGFCSEKYLKK